MGNLYMQMPGIAGSVSTQDYQKWIGLSSVSFTSERSIKTNMGVAQNRDMSMPHFSEVEIVKHLDAASNGLFQALHKGKNLAEVRIHLLADGNNKPLAKYLLNNVLIAKHEHFLSSEGLPTEVVRLNYTRIEVTYIAQDASGKPLSQTVSSYDLTTLC